jgi:hypothetical protein
VGVIDVVYGVHDVALAKTLGGRVVGGLSMLVGGLMLAPLLLLLQAPRRKLDPLAAYVAAVLMFTQGLALLFAETFSHTVRSARVLAPILLLVLSVVVASVLRRQHSEFGRSWKFGIRASIIATLLSAAQIGIGLTARSAPPPGGILLSTHVTEKKGRAVVAFGEANRSQSNVPILGDVIDVVAFKCVTRPRGAKAAQQSLKARQLPSSGVARWLESMELLGCHSPTLIDTGEFSEEGSFLPPGWSESQSETYAMPTDRNTVCVYHSLSTIEQSLERLGSLPVRSVKTGLIYRYRLEPTGWIDGFVQSRQEVVVHWERTVERYDSGSGTYRIPGESAEYTVNGVPHYSAELLSPGGVVSSSASCS